MNQENDQDGNKNLFSFFFFKDNDERGTYKDDDNYAGIFAF